MKRTPAEEALLTLYRLAKITNPDGARRVLREARYTSGDEIFSANVLTTDESTDMFSAWTDPPPTA